MWLRDRLRAGLGGVCLYAHNISSPGQLRDLTDAIMAENPYAIIAVDEEGGDVTRLFAATGAPFPGNAVLGRTRPISTPRCETAAAIGWSSLRQCRLYRQLRSCVDINSRSDNPVIGVRSFGSDAGLVARHGQAWVTGLQSTGVAASAKHFPGHGDTAQDSHVSLPVVNRSLDELRSCELPPFAAAIDAGCRVVMTSHILLPRLDRRHPATMSRIVLQDLLRGELWLLRGDRERRPRHGRCFRLAGDGGRGRRCVASRLRSALSRNGQHRCSDSRDRAGSEQCAIAEALLRPTRCWEQLAGYEGSQRS